MNTRQKIALFDAKPHDIEYFDKVNEDFCFEMSYFEERLTANTSHKAQGFDAICIFVNDPIDKMLIETLCSFGVKAILLRSAGYDHVDIKAAHGKLSVFRVPEYSPHSVAEFAVGLMLSLNRKLHHAFNRVRVNDFSINGLMGFDMHGKTVGVVGAGHIGKAVIQILKGFGMNVLAYDIDPFKVESAGCAFTELDTIYKESDIITLHCPLTSTNSHMINRHTLAKMKDGVMLINTGRGGLINTYDLIEALKSGKVSAAGLDVYEKESKYFYQDFSMKVIEDEMLCQLHTFQNVLMTAHQAFFTQEAVSAIARTTLENAKVFFEGKPRPAPYAL